MIKLLQRNYYYNILIKSWQTLLRYNIASLPVNVTSIARQAGVKLIKNSDAHLLVTGEAGISIQLDGIWCIIYDDTRESAFIRFVIAHELWHILYNLPSVRHSYTLHGMGRPREEEEADMFAIRLLAPIRVLQLLKIDTPDQIIKYCDIPYVAAEYWAERMIMLDEMQMHDTVYLEHELCKRFMAFIDGQRHDNPENK